MTAPTPNATLAYRVLDHIDAHPDQWNQGLYIGPADCGTVACFAGWTCLLSGEKAAYIDGRTGYSTAWLIGHEGEPQSVPDRAEQLLRAGRLVVHEDEDEEDWDLFGPSNTREDLGWLVAEIFGPRPAVTS